MPYEIKKPDWGFKPGKKETRQRIITGAVTGSSGLSMASPYFYTSLRSQILDFTSSTFASPAMQTRDFEPFAKELIDSGTVVLDSRKGRFFIWNLPEFSFEISQYAEWVGERGPICSTVQRLPMLLNGYRVLLSPYLYLMGDITRLSVIDRDLDMFLRLSYTCYKVKIYGRRLSVAYSRCSEYDGGGESIADDYFSLSQSNYADLSITKCMSRLTLSQLLGVEDCKNGFFIQYSGPSLSYGFGGTGARRNYTFTTHNMFIEGQSAIRARVMLPELFAPVGSQSAVLTTSAPIISGCIVRFVKNVV